MHAAQQDLDVLTHACGAVPSQLYDTQLASGFLGYSTPSLVSLLMSELKVSAAKGDRLTDWLRRPLTDEQLAYAAADVDHLLALQDQLDLQLAELGRSQWVAEACEELRQRPVSGTDPSQAWLRIKDVRMLKPRARGVARAVCEWRERRAMSVDVPVRQILPDLAVLGIAQRQPKTTLDLVQARGVEERHSRGNLGKEILDAVADGQRNDIELPAPDGEEFDRHLRPAVALVSAWMADLARKQRVDTSLLATRADLVALLRGDNDARLLQGWRARAGGRRHSTSGARQGGSDLRRSWRTASDRRCRRSVSLRVTCVLLCGTWPTACRTRSLTSAERAPYEWIGRRSPMAWLTITRWGTVGCQIVLATDDAGQFVVPPVGFAADRRHLVDDDTGEFEVGVVGVPDLVDGVGDSADAAKAQCSGLDDDQGQIGGDQSVHRQIAERRRAIDQNGVVVAGNLVQGSPQSLG